MKLKENIIFLGMMGSGKTSIGSKISKKLEINFFDIDQEIEKELNTKISEIFETKGEAFFRDLEEKITLKILKKNNIVVSLGGGAFLNKNIQKEVLENHLSFWLKWNYKILLERIRNSQKRPLAFKASDNELIDLIKKRSNIYSKAHYEIECDNQNKDQIVNKVLKICEIHQTKN